MYDYLQLPFLQSSPSDVLSIIKILCSVKKHTGSGSQFIILRRIRIRIKQIWIRNTGPEPQKMKNKFPQYD